jgi:hypothetical protein
MRRRARIVERHDLIPAGRGDASWSPVGPPEPGDADPPPAGDADTGWRLFWWGVEADTPPHGGPIAGGSDPKAKP